MADIDVCTSSIVTRLRQGSEGKPFGPGPMFAQVIDCPDEDNPFVRTIDDGKYLSIKTGDDRVRFWPVNADTLEELCGQLAVIIKGIRKTQANLRRA